MVNLEENEKIIKIVRKHWFAIVLEMITSFAMILGPIIFFELIEDVLFHELTLKNLYLLLFFYFVYLLFVWAFMFINWLNYYLDIWIITDKRIVNIEQKRLFSREISSLRLDNIQDVKIEMHGIINTLFKIGNMQVQTSSPEIEFILPQAINPENVKHIIMEAHNREIEKVKTVKIQG
jgi:hypothetical protein